MASSRDRQRKLAREKLDRQMARRAARARRRRQIQAGVGVGVVLALVVVGSVWALGGFDRDPEEHRAEPDVCAWTQQDPEANSGLKDVGTPPTKGLPTSGTLPMTITTNQGAPITVELDLAGAPCAAASISHLSGQSFYDNTTCHEITTEGALRCGDPSGTGLGGAAYSRSDENPPAADQSPAYPKGTVAMLDNPPGADSSQFLIFFKDFAPTEPAYSVIGKVTGGLDVVEKIGALETVDNGSGAKVKPKTDVVIQSLTVGESATPAPAPSSPAATPSASAAAS